MEANVGAVRDETVLSPASSGKEREKEKEKEKDREAAPQREREKERKRDRERGREMRYCIIFSYKMTRSQCDSTGS